METDITKEQLKLLMGTRLLADTIPELGRHIGHNLKSSGNLYKIGGKNPFRREAIYHQLCHEVRRDLDLDLDILLHDYRRVSAAFVGNRRRRVSAPVPPAPQQAEQLLRALDDYEEDDHYEQSIALLLHFGLLPLATANTGDARDVKESLYLLADVLNAIAATRPSLSFKTVENIILEECERSEPRRIHLVKLTHDLLNYLADSSSYSGRHAMSSAMSRHELSFPLDGIWVNADKEGTVFWKITEMARGCTICRCQFSDADRSLRHTDYTAIIFDADGDILLEVFHPRFIADVVEHGKASGKHDAIYTLSLDNLDQPAELLLKDKHVEEHFFDGLHLRRADNPEAYQKRLDSYTLTDSYPDCHGVMRYDLAAITPEALYVRRSRGGYYRVPRDLRPGLDLVGIDDLAGEMQVLGHRYLTFDSIMLYLPIDDEKNLPEGIKITASPQPSPTGEGSQIPIKEAPPKP